MPIGFACCSILRVIAGAIFYFSKKNLPGMYSAIAPLPSRRRCRRRDRRAKKPIAVWLKSKPGSPGWTRKSQAMTRDRGEGSSRGRSADQGCGGRRCAQNRRVGRAGDCGGSQIGAARTDRRTRRIWRSRWRPGRSKWILPRTRRWCESFAQRACRRKLKRGQDGN